jgi:hypothetical protein
MYFQPEIGLPITKPKLHPRWLSVRSLAKPLDIIYVRDLKNIFK